MGRSDQINGGHGELGATEVKERWDGGAGLFSQVPGELYKVFD